MLRFTAVKTTYPLTSMLYRGFRLRSVFILLILFDVQDRILIKLMVRSLKVQNVSNYTYYYPTLLRRVQKRAKRVQISHDICTRLIPPTARKIKKLGKSEFWGNENVG